MISSNPNFIAAIVLASIGLGIYGAFINWL